MVGTESGEGLQLPIHRASRRCHTTHCAMAFLLESSVMSRMPDARLSEEPSLRQKRRNGIGLHESISLQTRTGSEVRALAHLLVRSLPRTTGSPAERIVFYELYSSPAQIAARSHPNVIAAHKSLLTTLFHASPETQISLHTPISYFDRLRIRPPGPSQFTLGPHMDGGGIERWEDTQYRKVYAEIFKGGANWRIYDAWDLTERVGANQDLYNAPYVLDRRCAFLHRAHIHWIHCTETSAQSCVRSKAGSPSRIPVQARAR